MIYLITILIIIILVAVGVLTVRHNGDDNPNGNGTDENEAKRWEDLYNFKSYLYHNYTVIEKNDEDVSAIEDISEPGDSAWVIIGVEKEFTSEEASTIRNFIDSGGTCIIAAESDHVNKIAQQYSVSFTGHRILETEKFDANEIFVPTDAYIGGAYYHILTNSPVGITYNEEVKSYLITVLAKSSENTGLGDFSFLDKNDNGIAEADDEFGPINMIVEVKQKSGDGKIIFICDSAVFTDDLWDLDSNKASYENDAFSKALLKYSLSKQGTVIYDYSKHVNPYSGHKLYPR